MTNTLFLLEGPPQNPQDLTLRARRVLQQAACIVAQDLPAAKALLRTWQIETPLRELCGLQTLLDALQQGDVAWIVRPLRVPHALVQALLGRGIEPVPIPGPAPEIAALTLSGLPADQVTFLGPLPNSPPERRALLRQAADEPRTLLCTVLAAQLPDAWPDLGLLGDDRPVTLHSSSITWRGKTGDPPPACSGECTLIVSGAEPAPAWTEQQVRIQVRELLAAGTSPRDTARTVADRAGWSKRRVYAMVTAEKKK